jgi:hypothetical protein
MKNMTNKILVGINFVVVSALSDCSLTDNHKAIVDLVIEKSD